MAGKSSLTDKEKDELILKERQVKALEKIAASTDAIALWFEEKDLSAWDERMQFYLHEFHTKFVNKELNCKTSKVLLKKLIENGKIKPVGQIMKQSGRVDIFKKYKIDDLIEIAIPWLLESVFRFAVECSAKVGRSGPTAASHISKAGSLPPLLTQRLAGFACELSC